MTKNKASKKFVLVTGAGTGLGFATAKLLAADGWKVFATHIPSQSPEELQKIKNVTPVVVEITDQKSVDKIYEKISKEVGEEGLAALVNVAGVAGIAGGIVEGVPEDRIRELMEVNLFGTLRMIRTFLPLLRKYGPARVANVSTSGVRVPVAFSGIYAISKYAVEGITNSLRYELSPFGIQLTSIEPGAMRTPMTADHEVNMKKTWDMMPEHIRDIYYDKISPSLEVMADQIINSDPPEVVAKVILKSLNAKKMRIRYVGGKMVKYLPFLQRFLGENLFEKMVLKTSKLLPPKNK